MCAGFNPAFPLDILLPFVKIIRLIKLYIIYATKTIALNIPGYIHNVLTEITGQSES